MNEQRVSDLIEQLQRFGVDTRIEGHVNLKWNDKRTAVVVTEDGLLELLQDAKKEADRFETLVDKLNEDNSELEEQNDEQESTIAKLECRIGELEEEIENLELENKERGELDA